MIDAAGAIYVIGGCSDGNSAVYNDVWISTDGGADPDSVRGARRGLPVVLGGVLKPLVLQGYWRGGVLRRTIWVLSVLAECSRVSSGAGGFTRGVLSG